MQDLIKEFEERFKDEEYLTELIAWIDGDWFPRLKAEAEKAMPIRLVFHDWCGKGSMHSVYNLEEGIELQMGDFHAGTTFGATIALDAEERDELTAAIDAGYTPLFYVVKEKDYVNTKAILESPLAQVSEADPTAESR